MSKVNKGETVVVSMSVMGKNGCEKDIYWLYRKEKMRNVAGFLEVNLHAFRDPMERTISGGQALPKLNGPGCF